MKPCIITVVIIGSLPRKCWLCPEYGRRPASVGEARALLGL